jgi:hypothetical protein
MPSWNYIFRLSVPEFSLIINYIELNKETMSRDSVVGIASGYGLDDRGVGFRVPVGSRILSSRRCPDRLWGPPNLISDGYWGLSPRG